MNNQILREDETLHEFYQFGPPFARSRQSRGEGTGFPARLRLCEIPVQARTTTVAEHFEVPELTGYRGVR